ncbi:MAG: AmmeMemoRadiSam system protein B [Proteobacteria bacterium]|nr:AmmeMemoRadiSam system protein B [Pseudomonadota bacterium]MBU4297676.1 AmmeMemoRadiSam system protein B [Pseudomonadota bacterium]MCG2748389.1 AmmeMemoRadiSam system protein B [Desulfobulbaceae bacterium]
MRRSPVVANQFYPGDPRILRNTLADLIPEGPTAKKNALAVISPHAGFIYSGGVAGETFAAVNVPEDVIILGPNHHGQGPSIAMMAEGEWEMPLGTVSINVELAQLISDPVIKKDELAHRFEHSLEVQVPFLQMLQKNLSIVPLVISHIPYSHCLATGRAIADAIKKYHKPVLLVASTDMTHYEPRVSASRKDHLALEHIKKLDPQGLYDTVLGQRISMCGIMPTTIVLIAALELGAKHVQLIRYTDSGETSGDTDHVVGYAGLVVD